MRVIKPIPQATPEQKEIDWQVKKEIVHKIDVELDRIGINSNLEAIHDTIVILHNMGYMRITGKP